ncbi:MAG: AgmX/PglI C-terminal domain-containing protein [Myxococcales bacterium]|nr:AgmX/PglI C-terminal domain-containing protein [Myxococcales bacterium]
MIVRRVALLTGVLVAGLACNKQGETKAPVEDAPQAEAADPDGEADAENKVEEEESPYLDAMNFNRTVEADAGQIVACWRDTAGKDAPPAKGRVKTTVVVDGDGRVKEVKFDPQRSTLKNDALNACIEGKLKALKFNITLNGADSPMPYTFDLSDDGLLK